MFPNSLSGFHPTDRGSARPHVMRKLTGKENITLSEFQKQFGTELAICVTNATSCGVKVAS